MSQGLLVILLFTIGFCNGLLLDIFKRPLGISLPRLPFGNNKEETRCYDELGCLSITKAWFHISRPINMFPLSREVINTKFILYTRNNPYEGQLLRVRVPETIENSNFDATKQTKLIVHGFLDSSDNKWVGEMRLELLKHADWNVVAVDWAGGSRPLYTQAAANTRLVGLEIAYFINYLSDKYGLKPEDVHIIGHSLGAHTAGYAGERVKGLGRITGLDPAEPYFQGLSAHIRLDPSDAALVDVIHTDSSPNILLGYGMSEPCGHIDFYPNNGKQQPGCGLAENLLPLTLIKEGIEDTSRVLVCCNHIRAIKLFTESINSQCPYVAHRCSSYQHFLQGHCFSCSENGTGCAVMGLHVQRGHHPAGSKYFVTTGKKEPYCRYHYRVTLDLAKPAKAESWVQGFMKVTLHSDNSIVRNLDLTPGGYDKFQHGTSRSCIVALKEDIGPVHQAELNWETDEKEFKPCSPQCNDHLYVSSITVEEEPRDISSRSKQAMQVGTKLCSSSPDYVEILSHRTTVFDNHCDLRGREQVTTSPTDL